MMNSSITAKSIILLQIVGLLSIRTTNGFVVNHPSNYHHHQGIGRDDASMRERVVLNQSLTVDGMWTRGNNFGKGRFKFYKSFEDWMSPFGDEDRETFPEIFNLPEGVYEVSMSSPLGIVFEECGEDGRNSGVYVKELVEGGRAEAMGTIKPGDLLIALTAVKVSGAKWERRLIPALTFDFDTVVGAIGSNDVKWGCDDIILQFARPDEFDSAKVDTFLEFFEPPSDTPWKL